MVGGVFVSIEVIQPGERAGELLRQLDAALPEVRIDTEADQLVPVILRDAKNEQQAKATLEEALDGLEDAADWPEFLQVRITTGER